VFGALSSAEYARRSLKATFGLGVVPTAWSIVE
jgi:hypothetical protein